MPRNRSEKSPSGDPQIDAYLRMWLTNHDSGEPIGRGPFAHQLVVALNGLSVAQRKQMNNMAAHGRWIALADVRRLYGTAS